MTWPRAASTIASSKLLNATTPQTISEQVLEFCSEISIDFPPIYVPVIPHSNAELNQCFYNVRDNIEVEGGNQIFGWTIWEFPEVYLEAECHSVWQAGSGGLLDITPKKDAENRILFLRDDRQKFDFVKPKWKDNRRKSLHSNPAVAQYLNAARRLNQYIIHNSRPKGKERETRFIDEKQVRRYRRLHDQVSRAKSDLIEAING